MGSGELEQRNFHHLFGSSKQIYQTVTAKSRWCTSLVVSGVRSSSLTCPSGRDRAAGSVLLPNRAQLCFAVVLVFIATVSAHLFSILLLYLLTFISWGSRCTWTLEMKTEIWTGNMADWHVPHYHCYICWTYVLKIKTLHYSKPWGWGPGGRPVHAPPRAFILEADSSVTPTLANTEST